ncbi:uncharacterized protein LOC103312864 [Tribolium castaneum]|uniref:Uncharacterized protein n=1 Tax=Tribolium castaneum TaxID=7070 RepID=D2A274_TRICA|nr:PREDICTED: uncharacterized protein LOC103312864 [Tribolium castaneum]EFA02748.1 hypothetical protein TcasGA2_TC008480 [Tribolium castaneum]|eukprot:XP_008192868.1 PREDICTED: uncharacterized protein LOC103312864 [Tribolium castaneum]
MSASCSCLKLCSVVVALSNLTLGLYILAEGILLLTKYLNNDADVTVGFVVVDFQMASFLIFVGLLLLIGIIKGKEKHISLYLLLSSLIWFIITMLAVSYMIFYNTTGMTVEIQHSVENNYTTAEPKPKETVPMEKAVGFSLGLIAIWCGQLGVYKFHDQVIEKNMINAGQSYVSSAIHSS